MLKVEGVSGFLLRPITTKDLENLRHWKNEHREFFFHKDKISSEQQRKWFDEYQKRPHDFMFITELYGQAFGCIGIRKLDNIWDMYNLILGKKEFGKQGGGWMISKAIKTILAFALSTEKLPLTLRVLKHNRVKNILLKHGFVISEEYPDHYKMIFQPRE